MPDDVLYTAKSSDHRDEMIMMHPSDYQRPPCIALLTAINNKNQEEIEEEDGNNMLACLGESILLTDTERYHLAIMSTPVVNDLNKPDVLPQEGLNNLVLPTSIVEENKPKSCWK
jgi:hypothetical protein